MLPVLALAVRMVGGIQVPLADLYDPACLPLREVEIFCAQHGEGWSVHAWPVTPPCYGPYHPTNRWQTELIGRLS